MDEFGFPIIYDVREWKTREGVKGAPIGTWLTDGRTGRRRQVHSGLPLDPDYLADRARMEYMASLRDKRGND